MERKNDIYIGQMLIEAGVITAEDLEKGLKEQKNTDEFICTILVSMGLAQEDTLLPVLSRQLNMPFVKIKNLEIQPEVISKVPAKFATHYKLMPISLEEHEISLAVTDPLDVHTLDDLKLLLGLEVKPMLAGEKDILEAIHKYYGVGAETLEEIVSEKNTDTTTAAGIAKTEDLEALAEDASIIKFVNQILTQALSERASDIHIEPFEDELKVRMRVDGILYDTPIPPTIKYFHQAIVSRIKIMANLNIAERRLPQDGRIKVKLQEKELDLRVSIIPASFGESVQIRVLSSIFFLNLEKLGFMEDDLKKIASVIKKPHGIIFVTGPTGAGKSTTLYASLAKINSSSIKIITVEDPVEYQLRGVMQIQVMPKIGLTFAAGLRSILRHDPDVIMVGEVRDYETAEVAIRASLTGHLVFSTLHTNDAAGAITRLLDMGVEPFLVSSSLECMIAQRLVRLICPECRAPAKVSELALKNFGVSEKPENVNLFAGKGCPACKFSGYRGRTGIYEIIVMNDCLREMVIQKASSQQIKRKAIEFGMRSLRSDGWNKIQKGLTTIEEVMRVTQIEETVE
ncbi:MAG: type II secretion system protein GspE [Omnitrophica WOR_2 bacterium GWF2_43_52]|nr:MAG: type II secretion system protein GspE [Omnitrophica WOR_2 bacterium GWA2_44_7]OGX21832.1 MAG: type II secretion system protein GspE [Omnitrophica WOR_2 bacterium GWF2_43_52]HAH21687.1 type II secretion system protein GspE [Candidatus Omnitrophota bacterium]HBG64793.1 type II secretion system protein GspE [Candidatus Omnitrophota bacterium]